VEESVLPRLYRESPLNSIWEGPANVQALDVLRALQRQPESLDAVLHELESASASDARLDAAVSDLRSELADPDDAELRARRLVEQLGLCLQAQLLISHGSTAVADAFCATRLAGAGGRTYGTLPRGIDYAAIVERNRPAAA
jgi:putative acyl-CoA dehydrogenase